MAHAAPGSAGQTLLGTTLLAKASLMQPAVPGLAGYPSIRQVQSRGLPSEGAVECMPAPHPTGVDIIVTTLPRCGWGVGGGAVEPGGSDDGMTITICSFDSFTGTDDSELQAILAKCVKK